METLALSSAERRVLGVLIEKGLTTPEYYPMTLNALIAGCNQKNNRDPVTSLFEAEIEPALKGLAEKGLALSIVADTGRVTRWRQELARKWALDVTEMAILGELLLRGAQSEGDLRGRASRMRPIDTLEALRELLQKLRAPTEARPALVIRLSSESAARGVRWTHALGPVEEVERARDEDAGEAPIRSAAAAAAAPADLLARVAVLEARVAKLEELTALRGGPAPG